MSPGIVSSGSVVGLSMNPSLIILVFYHFLQDHYLNHCICPEEVASGIILTAACQNQTCDKSLINSFAWQKSSVYSFHLCLCFSWSDTHSHNLHQSIRTFHVIPAQCRVPNFDMILVIAWLRFIHIIIW